MEIVDLHGNALNESKFAVREQAWLDGLCDKHAATQCGIIRASYQTWRKQQGDMPTNFGICPKCEAEKNLKSCG